MPEKPTYEELEHRILELEKAESGCKGKEDAFREQLQRYKMLMDVSPDGIAIIDQEHRIREANSRFEQMLGYTAEELFELRTWDWENEMTESEIRANFSDISKTRTTFESRHRRKDGTVYDVEVTAGGTKLGGVPMVLTISRDITDRKQAEKALRDSEITYRQMFDHMGSGVAVYKAIDNGKNFAFKDFNKAAEKIEQLSKDDLIGKLVTDVFPSIIEFGLFDVFQRVWQTGQPEYHPISFYKDERIEGWRDNYICKLPSGEIVAIYDDVTERKQTEEALRINEEKYRGLFDESITAIYLFDKHKNFIDSNQAGIELLGYSKEELLSMSIPDVDADPIAVLPAHGQLLGGDRIINYEHKLKKKDGEIITVLNNSRPISNADGNVIGMQSTLIDITERKQIEEALVQSEDRFQLAMRFANDGLFDWDLISNEIYYSPGWKRLLGYEDHEIPNRFSEWERLTHKQDIAESWAMLKEVIEGRRERFEIEFRMRHKDGHWVDILSRANVARDAEGKGVRMVGTHVDITRRKQAEEELRKRESHLSAILQTTADGFWIVDTSATIIEVNQAYCKMTGYTREELLGMSVRDLEANESEEETAARIQRIMRQGSEVFAATHLRKDGSLLPLELSVTFSAEQQGQFFCFCRDQSERMADQRRIQASEAKYRALFDQSFQGIYLHDFQGNILETNQMACQQTGYTREEFLGLTVFDLHPFEGDSVNLPKKRILEEWQTWGTGQRVAFEAEHKRKNGTVFPVHVVSGVVSYGESDLILAIVQDISDSKRAEQERQRLESQLAQAQKMDALGTLSGGIAHDFNNILAAILGYSELALDDLPKDSAPARQDLAEITKAALKAKNLVRQILTFSRVAEGQRRPLSLGRVAQESCAILERTLPKMIDLRLDFQEGLWPVTADPQQMEQVFINLAANAGDAIDGSGVVTISAQNLEPGTNHCLVCGEELTGRQVLVAVEDDGHGMSPEVLAKIFEPFFTTKGVGKGTGLGLSTVYGIVTGHGGHLCCRSQKGEGSKFFIYLPAESREHPDFEHENGKVQENLGGSGRILVVDDEPAVRDIAQKMLTRAGYEVLQAASGEEALVAYRGNKGKIDLVLLDLGMPGMGGKACLTGIRRLDPNAKVLIASGYLHYELTDELETLGAAGMVSKPYRKSDILTTVDAVLGP